MKIPCKIYIKSPDNNPSNISFTVQFESKYVQNASIGDVIQGGGYEYIIVSPTQIPVRYNGVIFVERINHTENMVESTSYDHVILIEADIEQNAYGSKAYILSSGSYQKSDTKFWVILNVFDNVMANSAIIGDKIIDRNGNEYVLIKFNNNQLRFTDKIVVEALVNNRIAPVKGHASLFRPTEYLDLSMAINRNDLAESKGRQRDNIKLDSAHKEFEESQPMYIELPNGSESVIRRLTPVCVDNGMFALIDIGDSELSFTALAIMEDEPDPLAVGRAVSYGLMKDIGGDWPADTVLYIDPNGELSSVVPEIGVNAYSVQDYIIRAGIVVVNKLDSNKFDLMVDIKIIARL